MNRRRGRAGAALLACLALTAAGCTASISPPRLRGTPPDGAHGKQPVRAVTSATLTAFHSCPGALAALRKAAQASVTPYGLPNGTASSQDNVAFAAPGVEKSAPAAPDSTAAGVGAPMPAPAAAAAPGAASGAAASTTPAFSGTNDYTVGVDEPDMVKTDGRRIVTVSEDTLEVIDAASRRVTGTLNLASYGIQPGSVNLLLNGDHALLLAPYAGAFGVDGPAPGEDGPRFFLVDLAGKPRVLASYTIDGDLVDARLVGSVVRIVTGSRPTIEYPPMPAGASNAKRLAAYRAVTGRASLDAWLPGYESTDSSGDRIDGRVPCTAVSRPQTYSGTNLLTVLTFDLSADAFGTGDPVSLVADGDTVYGTAASLYVASGGFEGPVVQQEQDTKVYRFDITGPGAPRFAASGAVPGYLVNQYAMSEWNGYLRVATTTGTSWAVADGEPAGARTSSSAVYELTTLGPVMRIVGEVTGLGTTERIYAVRFIGPVGYVVTFRQTDPLYTLDLSDPSRPSVVGELGLTGYSAYLQPVSASRLVGIGQQADSVGHVLGTQVSLFDVSDLAAPARLATYALASSMSAAQLDPHAFLYWPADQLVVVPIQASGPVVGDAAATATQGPESGALVLRINGGRITVAGFIRQPQTAEYYGLPIERSLVIGQTLWTVSTAGLLASDLASLRQQAWLPFSQTGISYPEPSGGSANLP